MRLLIGCSLIVCLAVAGCGGSSATPTATPGVIGGSAPEGEVSPESTLATQPEIGLASISMVSTATEVRPGQEFSVVLAVDPGGRGISGVDVKIRFDSAILEMVQPVRVCHATAGDLLGEKPDEVASVIPSVEIDNATGTLSYLDVRIGPTSPPTPPGILGTLKVRVLETAPVGTETSLRLTEVHIPDENIEEIADLLIGDDLAVVVSP